ncbi:MAG: peptidase S9, partial [Chloroflexota bacterium]|nr:peptidase S9 [Chloroflexota bacterium]
VLALSQAVPAQAQYFGRNPVQWERLRFEVLQTEHFDIHYYAEEKAAAEQVGRMAERWYTRLSTTLGFQLKERQPVVLYASQGHFQQTNTIGGQPGEGTGGVTEAFKRRIVMPVGASLAETDHVLGHELVHAFQYAMTGQGRLSSNNIPSALQMPLWFIEGMAEYLSVGPHDAHTAMWIRDATRKEKIPTLAQLDDRRYFPYRYGQAVWAYLAGRFGDEVMGKALKALRPKSNDAGEILKLVTGVDEKTLSKEWHAALRAGAAPQLVGRKSAAEFAAALVTEEKDGGEVNVGPALSPDGSRLAFLSERDQYSIELFVADAKTGQVTRRLSRQAVDPHLESLQFINSAGAWDREGTRVALGAVSKGRPLLVILDARTGDRVREVPLPTLGEIQTPSFSPDGKRVVFGALAGGFSDLFVYDLESSTLRRLTEDAYADLQPSWSPDGSRIAFTTDRFSTDLEHLHAGSYRLALLDVASGDIRALPAFPAAKNINPQWSPSGDSVYFLSDAGGATNVYRVSVPDGALFQLTDLRTGASGITALSPALSVAARANRLAFSVYESENYEIYAIEDVERLAGWPVGAKEGLNADLIPGGKAAGPLLAAHADPQRGLPDASEFIAKPYRARFGLDFVGQPSVGAGVGQYGGFVSGGVALAFSDMLGEHSLQTIVQADSVAGFNDIGAVVSYVNRVHRFNWGVQAAQLPYVTGSFASGVTTSGGQQVYVEQTVLQRQMDRSISALGSYPFDPSLRLELHAGYRNIGFDTSVRTEGFSANGQRIIDEEENIDSGDSVRLFESTAALVRDTSVFGGTGPVLGQRLRVDVSPVLGTVNYTGALVDYRHYVMPVRPVTIAGRILHYGRYG